MHVDAFTDGEIVDSVEHFFWGMVNGTAMEIGALDGSPATRSMTHRYASFCVDDCCPLHAFMFLPMHFC